MFVDPSSVYGNGALATFILICDYDPVPVNVCSSFTTCGNIMVHFTANLQPTGIIIHNSPAYHQQKNDNNRNINIFNVNLHLMTVDVRKCLAISNLLHMEINQRWFIHVLNHTDKFLHNNGGFLFKPSGWISNLC